MVYGDGGHDTRSDGRSGVRAGVGVVVHLRRPRARPDGRGLVRGSRGGGRIWSGPWCWRRWRSSSPRTVGRAAPQPPDDRRLRVIAVAGCQLAYFNAVSSCRSGRAADRVRRAGRRRVAVAHPRAAPRSADGRGRGAGGCRAGAGARPVGGTPVDVVGVIWAFGAMLGVATYFLLSGRQDDGLPPTVLAAAGLCSADHAAVAGATGALTFTATTTAVRFGDAGGVVGARARPGVVTAAPPRHRHRHAQARLAAGVLRRLIEVLAALGFACAARRAAARPADGGAGAGGRGGGQVRRARLTSADVRAGQLRSAPNRPRAATG